MRVGQPSSAIGEIVRVLRVLAFVGGSACLPLHAINGPVRVSQYGNGVQIWFEAEHFDQRLPEDNDLFPVIEELDAFEETAVTRVNQIGGMLRYNFDISDADGETGEWRMWGRVINPNNASDYMLVEGDPGDPSIPTAPPFPGGDGAYDNADDRIFEQTSGPPWTWSSPGEGHLKELRDGVNSMFLLHRQGDGSVMWDVLMWSSDPDYVPSDVDYDAADELAGCNGEPIVVERAIEPRFHEPGDVVEITVRASNVRGTVTVAETVPDGFTVEDAGDGTAGADTVNLTFRDDGAGSYRLRAPADSCAVIPIDSMVSADEQACTGLVQGDETLACSLLSPDGAVREQLIIGPIDLGGNTGPDCDDNGDLATTDYLTDGTIGEPNILAEEGEELEPDFFGEAGGVGVELAPNPDINGGGGDVLEVWKATADIQGRINFEDPDKVGGADEYVIYGLVYLVNTGAACRQVLLEVSADDAMKVLLNGQLLHVQARCAAVDPYTGGTRIPAVLLPGKNVLLTAVVEQGGGNDLRVVVRNLDDTPVTDGSVRTSLRAPDSYPSGAGLVARSIEGGGLHASGAEIRVTLTATGLADGSTVAESIPPAYTVVDAGGGVVDGGELTFDASGDVELSYVLRSDPLDCGCASIVGAVEGAAGCAAVEGDTSLECEFEEGSPIFRASEYGAGVQIWFEAEAFTERSDGGAFFPVVCKSGAFGRAVTRAGGGGRIRYDFDIDAAGGLGGTWYFWGRLVNPANQSDYLVVEDDPDDLDLIEDPPFPGGDGTYSNDDDRVFEENTGPPWGWARASHAEGHTKELRDGLNSMFLFRRSGNATVFWDVFLWTDDPGYVPSDDDYVSATPINIPEPPAPVFVFKRGDVDANGTIEITDPISNLSFQFLGDFQPPCLDALDWDDNGAIDVTDPIGSLTRQFLGGDPAPPPGSTECGEDPTPDGNGDLGCEAYPAASCGG